MIIKKIILIWEHSLKIAIKISHTIIKKLLRNNDSSLMWERAVHNVELKSTLLLLVIKSNVR